MRMKGVQKHATIFIPQVIILLLVLQIANAQRLKVNFYKNTCPSVETIVKDTTAKFISKAPTLAAPLLRMHFHDCFVRVSLRAYIYI